MLSEKAKGKQRAVDPPADSSAGQSIQNEEDWAQELVVRFTEGAPDLTITIRRKDLVRDVKKHVRGLEPEPVT